ncbi:3-keto-5-aminohexanoate cleavage protein [uncultured Roseobacter sp.]|uniref:3-keto-5-aminohexanoate cleavage protein n=1 Tax=uncultured Roseobacter sp. TaxID=114847 RepID=UPI00262BDF20|nr:3-keto-5-aminohexanoate cleavage protein [uncultured Roseobacter sp.]
MKNDVIRQTRAPNDALVELLIERRVVNQLDPSKWCWFLHAACSPVQVGLQANLYLECGVPARNDQLVMKVADIMETPGGTVMSPEETGSLLRL